MTETFSLKLTKQDLDRLQRLRASVRAFQNSIAPLPATESNNDYNEHFNQLRLEAKSILVTQGFDKRVSQAMTEEILKERQAALLPGLSGVVILGVLLSLLGLGVNSVVLNDVIINSVSCCVSSGGMLLIMGTLAIWSIANFWRRLSNLGDLYQRSDALLHQIDHTLNMALPGLANHSPTEIPNIRSVVDLALDSLNKQAVDWRQKLSLLEQQRLAVEPQVPLPLTLNLDFVRRELEQVEQEIERLRGKIQEDSLEETAVSADLTSGGLHEIFLPGGRKIAVSKVKEKLTPSEVDNLLVKQPPYFSPSEPSEPTETLAIIEPTETDSAEVLGETGKLSVIP